jgi:hypothetical protein
MDLLDFVYWYLTLHVFITNLFLACLIHKQRKRWDMESAIMLNFF